jgi:hypothetical protein
VHVVGVQNREGGHVPEFWHLCKLIASKGANRSRYGA